ncbi:MAG: four helix bundle protein [Deltaproteobacteria bacterium]|nr:four helix bundle protein [Deltaproteobacteria bacterium]
MDKKTGKLVHFRNLEVYKSAFDCSMNIFEIRRNYSPEERFSLVDQIRRSSRSVCSNLSEAWRKRNYIAHFKSKLTDAMSEASETQTWLDFCLACGYIDQNSFSDLDDEYDKIIAMLNRMSLHADRFCF